MCVWRGGKGLQIHSEILHCLRTVRKFMTDVGEGAGDSVEYRYQLIRRAVTLRQISK